MNFKKIISTMVLFSFFVPQVALGQTVFSPEPDEKLQSLPLPQLQPGEKDPGIAISPMRRGQRAPFSGVLFSPRAVADVIVEFESFEERLHIEIMRTINEQQAECDKKLSDVENKLTTDKKILQANIDSKDKVIKELHGQIKILKDEQESRWHPGAWLGIGAASGIALTVLTAFAISKASQ